MEEPEILADWEAELLGMSKKKLKKPTATPAWDPFQEVEVIDSRHLFKPAERDERRDRPKRRSFSSAIQARIEGRPEEVHHRDKDTGEIVCGSKDPIFYWTWQGQEATCFTCKQRTPEAKQRREEYRAKTRQKIRESKLEQRQNPLRLVQTSFQGEDFFA